MNELEELRSIYSDQYKSLNGFRPRLHGKMTVKELRAALSEVEQDLAREMEEDRKAKIKESAALKPSPAWTIGDFASWLTVGGSLEDDPRMYPGEENTPYFTA